jgi:hypothetical protein
MEDVKYIMLRDLPPGMDIIRERADVELVERTQALADAEGTTLGEAAAQVIREDDALASRYMDYSLSQDVWAGRARAYLQPKPTAADVPPKRPALGRGLPKAKGPNETGAMA